MGRIHLLVGWLWLVGAVGCASGDVVVWVVTDLFIATVVVAGAVAGFGAVVCASFVIVAVVDGEEVRVNMSLGHPQVHTCGLTMGNPQVK